MKHQRRRLDSLDAQLARDNERMAEVLKLLADPDFYINEDAASDVVAEHAQLKQRIAAAEEEWLDLSEQVERAIAREQARADV